MAIPTYRPASLHFRRFRNGIALAVLTLVGTCIGLSAAKLTGSGILSVSRKGGESILESQNGDEIGTLLKGTEIELLERDGKWVRFRLEGWIWGGSLEGFEEEAAEEERADPVVERRKPRPALQKHLPKIKKAINEYGVFYGIGLDSDLGELIVRFRVSGISRGALEHRQMSVQREVVTILEESVEFRIVRVETNRPDGSGQVGVEIAVTDVGDIRTGEAEDVAEWKSRTRISTDSGQTWSR